MSGVSDSDPAEDCQPRLPRLYVGDLKRKTLEEVAVFIEEYLLLSTHPLYFVQPLLEPTPVTSTYLSFAIEQIEVYIKVIV